MECWSIGLRTLDCVNITPSLHHSITPSLHHSITPSLHHSITPSLHHSRLFPRSFRPFRAYTSVLMNRIATCVILVCAVSLVCGQAVKTNLIAPGKQLGKMSVGDVVDDMKWLKKPEY